MGKDEDAMEYDQESIFKHLYGVPQSSPQNATKLTLTVKYRCFYLDSPDNARKNGMVVKAKNEVLTTKKWEHSFISVFETTGTTNETTFTSFEVLEKLIIENGGRIVDIDEPKLTHIVVDKRDTSRRVVLGKRTSKYVLARYWYHKLVWATDLKIKSPREDLSDEIS